MNSDIRVVFVGEQPPDEWQASIFLAGPTPRSATGGESWRPAAIDELGRQWRGPGLLVVFVPEPSDGRWLTTYDEQLAWEERWLDVADVNLFWVPRDMATLPGLTTNVEFGRYESSGRVVLGAPDEAVHVRYIQHHARRHGAKVAATLPDTIEAALAEIGPGLRRSGGERDVPLVAWRMPGFRAWLDAQRAAGNTLLSGRLLWTFRSYLWVFHARVMIAAEGRVKENEVVLGRPDAVSVVAYRRADPVRDSEIVLVREFRTPSTTVDGFVRELPGGGVLDGDTRAQAAAELAEETGIRLAAERLREHRERQAVATLSAHRVHVFAVELTDDEIAAVRGNNGPHGVHEDSERTYAEVHTLGEVLDGGLVDWVTVGVLSEVLLG